MILEGIVCTVNEQGLSHLTPLGYRQESEKIVLAPFVPSNTLDNLRGLGAATLSLTDDVRIFAGCLTGRREWPLVRADAIDGWRLADCLAHQELTVVEVIEDDVRPTFLCQIEQFQTHRPFLGFNRAQAAVVEAAILATRLEWLEPEKVLNELIYLSIAIKKTAGPREREAWQWLVDEINSHPSHHHTKAKLAER